jgi:hypothetical protein
VEAQSWASVCEQLLSKLNKDSNSQRRVISRTQQTKQLQNVLVYVIVMSGSNSYIVGSAQAQQASGSTAGSQKVGGPLQVGDSCKSCSNDVFNVLCRCKCWSRSVL